MADVERTFNLKLTAQDQTGPAFASARQNYARAQSEFWGGSMGRMGAFSKGMIRGGLAAYAATFVGRSLQEANEADLAYRRGDIGGFEYAQKLIGAIPMAGTALGGSLGGGWSAGQMLARWGIGSPRALAETRYVDDAADFAKRTAHLPAMAKQIEDERRIINQVNMASEAARARLIGHTNAVEESAVRHRWEDWRIANPNYPGHAAEAEGLETQWVREQQRRRRWAYRERGNIAEIGLNDRWEAERRRIMFEAEQEKQQRDESEWGEVDRQTQTRLREWDRDRQLARGRVGAGLTAARAAARGAHLGAGLALDWQTWRERIATADEAEKAAVRETARLSIGEQLKDAARRNALDIMHAPATVSAGVISDRYRGWGERAVASQYQEGLREQARLLKLVADTLARMERGVPVTIEGVTLEPA